MRSYEIAGLMEFDLTVSYDKLVMDNEILGMCQRVLRGIEVNDETLPLELMIEKGPGKDYLAEEHTVKNMYDEFFVPKLANRSKREQLKPLSDALSRARAFVKQFRASESVSKIDMNIREQILKTFPEIRKL